MAFALVPALAFWFVIPAGNPLLLLHLPLLLYLPLQLPFGLSFPQGIRFFFCRRHWCRFSHDPNPANIPRMPPRDYHFWVYILSSRSRNLYIGMTNNLTQRVTTHRKNTPGTHTARYAIHRLVYFEYFQFVTNAIAREKELKHWTRAQKIALIETKNPTWEDVFLKLQAPPETPQADSLRE